MDHLRKTKKESNNLKKHDRFTISRDSWYIYQNELDKACFQHDTADGGFEDWTRRTASDKILCDNAFNIAKNPKYDGYQSGLASIVYKFFDKKISGISNKE